MLAATFGGAALDVKDREPVWYTALNVVSGLLCVVFVLNFFEVVRLGNLSIPAILTLAALGYEAFHDARGSKDATTGEVLIAVLVVGVLFAPAAVLGLLG